MSTPPNLLTIRIMKQILKSFAVLALAAFAASCAKEQIAAPSRGGEMRP